MFQGYSLIIAISFHNCKENAVSSRIGRYSIAFLYVMALCLALTERLLWHGLRRSGVRDASRVCFDYETYYSGDLCVEFKSRLNDFEILFE